MLFRSLGESHDSGLRPGFDAKADNGISSGASRTVRGKSRDPLPFSRSAENGRFHNLFASSVVSLEHEGFTKVIGISYRDALSVWAGFWVCFFETGALSACLGFFDPRGFP